MIDQTFSASTRCVGDIFGCFDDADMLSVNRVLAVFLGIASCGTG